MFGEHLMYNLVVVKKVTVGSSHSDEFYLGIVVLYTNGCVYSMQLPQACF